MRCMYDDREYFEFLDGVDDATSRSLALSASLLASEYPGLRLEEAKAICVDWRRARRAKAQATV